MEKCVIGEGHPQFVGMYSGAASDSKTRQIVEGADLVLDLGGINLNDITTAAYSAKLDPTCSSPSVSTTSGSETMSLPVSGLPTCSRNWPSSSHHRRPTGEHRKLRRR
jgi:hypothetical protein